MSRWQKSLAAAITSPEELALRFGVDSESLKIVAECYPLRITPHYLSLISQSGDPIWKQCVPDRLELLDDQAADPLCEEGQSPVPGLIHRYPDRVVWLVSNSCAVYCRFCMRKRQVGLDSAPACSNRAAALSYIAANPAIRDVILSGGDPMLMQDDQLEELLTSIRSIPHVEIIRIGTRVPVTLPDRITPSVCRMLKKFHPLYINTHFNHPVELTPESAKACGMLADAGIVLGNQTVLLKGVNDSPQVMKELMTGLLKIRVKPYYIHQMDLVRGTEHFRTTVACGLEIMNSIRGHLSGLAAPYYVVDLPGGKGKVPLLPNAVRNDGGSLLMKNYLGETVEYNDP